jgi:hypothetical protein
VGTNRLISLSEIRVIPPPLPPSIHVSAIKIKINPSRGGLYFCLFTTVVPLVKFSNSLFLIFSALFLLNLVASAFPLDWKSCATQKIFALGYSYQFFLN